MSNIVILFMMGIGITAFIVGYWIGWHDHQDWLNDILEEYVRAKDKERKDKGERTNEQSREVAAGGSCTKTEKPHTAD